MGNRCPKCHADNLDDSRFCHKCATPLPAPEEVSVSHTKTLETPVEELTRGTTFAGRYEIIEELGKGGMGRVYRVEDKKLKQEVALKLIKPEIASDKKTIERFRNELKTARMIAHKNVCRMFDLGEAQGSHFITMEYIPGEDLKSMIRMSGQLGIGTTINIAKQICEGLAEAHDQGVIHRDLKPSNIMIDKEGNARIMDFGIARSLEAKSITGAGVMIGTPEYMSPEQVEGKEADQRSDIYSLGAILYEMVTGRVPFEGETPFTIGMKHKSEIPKDPSELNAQTPQDLSRVILKCLEKDKENRYQSANDVFSELISIEKGIPKTEREIPKRKPATSKEITITLGLKKLFFPSLVFFAVVIIGVIIWQLLPQEEVFISETGKPSIAVLPFEDLSPQKDQGHLCDGFAESIINVLSKVENIRIPAQTSTFSFRKKELDIQEISKKLKVKAVLKGSLQKSGNRVRITAQLINVVDESLLWSNQWDKDLNDVFSIQDEISLAIVDKLKVELLGEEKSALTKHYTKNVEAYNLYLQGRFFWNRRTFEGYQKSFEYFQKAIEIDPKYALAYSGIADYYILLGYYDYLPQNKAYPEAKKAAEKALEIDDTLAEAYTSLGTIKRSYDWDWLGTEQAFKQAIRLNPNYATAHHWYSDFLSAMGRHEEAIREARRAQELDPLSSIIRVALGARFHNSRQYDQAINEYQKAIELDPNSHVSHFYCIFPYVMKGMYDKALAEVQKARDLEGRINPGYKIMLSYVYGISGNKEEAEKILSEMIKLSEQRYVSPFGIALIYIGLGQNDEAFKWLEKAYDGHDHWLLMARTDPILDSIRSDPRFKALLKKMNL